MSVQLEGLSEAELKGLLETASDYKERSQIRSAIRKIKKERGEITDSNKAVGYTRRGHQIEPTTFKLDTPSYYGQTGTSGSNRRKDLNPNVPKPKHFIPGMMSPVVKRKDTDDYLSSEGSKSSLSTVHSSAERTASHDIVSTVEKETAVRANSYSFEHQMKIRNSPDLGYPESPVQTSPGIERPSYSTEGSDYQTQHNGTSDPQTASPQSPTEHDQTLTESHAIDSEASLEPAFNSIDTTHKTNYVQEPVNNRSKTSSETSSASQKADGELDQLTQQLAYCDNTEEQVQLRKKIRETRELAGKGRMQKHTSFIQIDVKKGNSASKTDSGSSSPIYTPQHNTVDEGDESSDIPANIHTSAYGQGSDISPKSSNSPLHMDLDRNEVISNEYSSDDYEGEFVPNQNTTTFTDLTQLVGDQPLIGRTGKKPTVREDGNIDFTNVLEKSGNHAKSRHSPRPPIEQHSFKGVLRKPSPQTVLSSPQNSKKNQEALQMDFRDVLTNRVTTNQHKNKLPPQKAVKPSIKNRKSPDEVEYEESLPQQLVFEHELLPRSPSPEQLPIPSHSQDCNSNYNNCQDYDTNSLDEKDPIGEDDKSVKDEAALAYRRDSLQTSQDSRKRLRDLHKQASLTKLRQSMTEDIPAVPSDPPIQEEIQQNELPTQQASPRIGTIETPSPLNPPSTNFTSQETPKLNSYEQRRLERKKKRELSGGRTADEDLQLQTDVQEFMQARNKKASGDKSPARSARESYLKSAGIKNDVANSRSPIASPNSHSSRTLNWAKSQTRGYDIEIKDLTHSWKNGLAFCALIHSYLPEEFDFGSLSASNPQENMELAFQVGSKYGVPQLFDPIDIIEMKVPDQRSIMTYLSSVYKELHNK